VDGLGYGHKLAQGKPASGMRHDSAWRELERSSCCNRATGASTNDLQLLCTLRNRRQGNKGVAAWPTLYHMVLSVERMTALMPPTQEPVRPRLKRPVGVGVGGTLATTHCYSV
jgi:hypothetical protein